MDVVNSKIVYCRICGIKCKKSVAIFSRRGRGMGLEQKALKCLMLLVKRSDQLPTRVCFPCIDRLDDFSQFLLHVKQAQVKLRAILKSQGIHVKDEKNVEANCGRGRRRKRKLEERIYDSSDSLSSDSVSDDSATSDELLPYDDGVGNHPLKKIALSDREMTSLEFPLKNEASGVICKSPMKPTQEATNSINISSDSTIEPSKIQSDIPMILSVPCSAPSAQVSQMQEGETTTSQNSVMDVQGSSNSLHQPTTTSGGINVTISPPLMFPAQVSNSMIVVPGTNLKSTGGGIVPFYIWNVPKGGSTCGVTRRSLPSIAAKNHSSKVAVSGKQMIANEDSNSYALSKPFILPKVAVKSATSSDTVVYLDSDNSSSLPTSKPNYSAQMSTVSLGGDSGMSPIQSEIGHVNQGAMIQKSSQCATKTHLLALDVSQTLPSQGNMFSSPKSSVYSEQFNCTSNPFLKPENIPQIAINNTSPVVSESSKLNDFQFCLENLRNEVGNMQSDNSPQAISDDSRSIQLLPSSHKDPDISLNKRHGCSSNSLESLQPSSSDVMSTGDKSENGRDSRESPLVKNYPKTLPVAHPRRVPIILGKSVCSTPNAKLLLRSEQKTKAEDKTFRGNEGDSTTSYCDEPKDVEHPSTSLITPVKAASPQRDSIALPCETAIPISEPSAVVESPNPSKKPTYVSLTHKNSSHSSLSNVGDSGTNSACGSTLLKSRNALGNDDLWKHNLSDIPPLIPITDPLLREYNNVESQDTSVSVTTPNYSLRSEHDIASEPLIIDEISDMELSNSNSCSEVAGTSAMKENMTCTPSKSDPSEKSATPLCKPEWMSSFARDIAVNPDYSVVKCCLCSLNSSPFFITLASASDHSKFIHSEGVGSFGCIRCDFTTNQQQQIPEQLQSLHCHVSSDCTVLDTSGVKSPQKISEDGSDVVEVKKEPVDVYETALLNLKNSLRSVKLPRFRKLITSCDMNAGSDVNTGIQKYPLTSSREADASKHVGVRQENIFKLKEATRNKLFNRQGSSYVCKLCAKKCNSKHQVKLHIGRHKPGERERFLSAEVRNCDIEESSTNVSSRKDNVSKINQSSEAESLSPKKMVFDIPPIKIEEDESPQAVLVKSNSNYLRNDLDSVHSPLILSDNDSISRESDGAVSSPKRNCGVTEVQRACGSNENIFHNSSSGFKIPFIKGEPRKFSSADKVTHKASISDSFFTPPPKGSSDVQEQSYGNHSRHSRSKPIVKPLFKSPTINKEGISHLPVSSPSCSNVDLPRKIEGVRPSKPSGVVNQCKKAVKKLSLKLLDQTSVSSSPHKESHLKGQPTNEPTILPATLPPLKSQLCVRGSTNIIKVFRPKPVQEPKINAAAGVSFSPILENPLPQQVDTPSKPQTESMTLNGLVLKVPFIKLQRLNLLNIDQQFSVMTQSHKDSSISVEKECEMKQPGDPKGDPESNASEKSCGSSSKASSNEKPKEEPLEKPDESIFGW